MQVFDDQLEEKARKLFAQPCHFMLGVTTLAQLPDETLPEIAFAGRSNVGKSSLVNAMTGRKTLARTSHTPGRTRQLNFFNLADCLRIVDMPGYGYARAPKRDIQEWHDLIYAYLRQRPNLRKLCLLIDARHGVKPGDLDLMAMLDSAAVPYSIILTKRDKVTAAFLEKTHQEILVMLGKRAAAAPEIYISSARKKQGIAAIRNLLASQCSSL